MRLTPSSRSREHSREGSSQGEEEKEEGAEPCGAKSQVWTSDSHVCTGRARQLVGCHADAGGVSAEVRRCFTGLLGGPAGHRGGRSHGVELHDVNS